MYIHLGQNTVVKTKDIIGIFDIENTSMSKDTKALFSTFEKSGRVVNVSYEIPKSFLLVQNKQEAVIYITPISSATLKKRWSKHA